MDFSERRKMINDFLTQNYQQDDNAPFRHPDPSEDDGSIFSIARPAADEEHTGPLIAVFCWSLRSSDRKTTCLGQCEIRAARDDNGNLKGVTQGIVLFSSPVSLGDNTIDKIAVASMAQFEKNSNFTGVIHKFVEVEELTGTSTFSMERL